VTGILEPLADTKLVLGGTEKTRLLLGVLTTLLYKSVIGTFAFDCCERMTYVVKNQKNLALEIGRCG
jgi:hypothetical protein